MTVEERLRAAAAETREYAAGQWPTALPEESRSSGRGWLAFVIAFAVVIVAFVTLPWLMRGQRNEVAAPLPIPSITSATDPTNPECSASGVPIPAASDELPTPVADMRSAVVEAVVACDLDRLVELAGPGFVTSFGGGDAENLRLWEEEGEGRLGTLLQILDLSHGVIGDGADGQIYVWPAAFAYDDWDEISTEHLEELGSLYDRAELDQLSLLGSHGGWRTGIDAEGDWLFFVAGD